MQLSPIRCSLFKIGYVCKAPKGFGIEQNFTQFADKIWCYDFTGFDAVDNYFATDVITMVDIFHEYDLDDY